MLEGKLAHVPAGAILGVIWTDRPMLDAASESWPRTAHPAWSCKTCCRTAAWTNGQSAISGDAPGQAGKRAKLVPPPKGARPGVVPLVAEMLLLADIAATQHDGRYFPCFMGPKGNR